jgi:hypothetical protein
MTRICSAALQQVIGQNYKSIRPFAYDPNHTRYRFDVESWASLGEDARDGNHELNRCIQPPDYNNQGVIGLIPVSFAITK